MMLVGWPRIMRFLATGYCGSYGEGPGRAFQDRAKEKSGALMAAGCPVFFLPELDGEARALTGDLLKWMKAREAQRRAGLGETRGQGQLITKNNG